MITLQYGVVDESLGVESHASVAGSYLDYMKNLWAELLTFNKNKFVDINIFY